jgi:hypothetical protein
MQRGYLGLRSFARRKSRHNANGTVNRNHRTAGFRLIRVDVDPKRAHCPGATGRGRDQIITGTAHTKPKS